jgi:hypothetical protein
MSDTFWADQLAAAKTAVAAYNAAILAFATSNIQNYQLDTGQTRTLVTRANLATLTTTRDSLLNEVATLEKRVCGSGVTYRPGW